MTPYFPLVADPDLRHACANPDLPERGPRCLYSCIGHEQFLVVSPGRGGGLRQCRCLERLVQVRGIERAESAPAALQFLERGSVGIIFRMRVDLFALQNLKGKIEEFPIQPANLIDPSAVPHETLLIDVCGIIRPHKLSGLFPDPQRHEFLAPKARHDGCAEPEVSIVGFVTLVRRVGVVLVVSPVHQAVIFGVPHAFIIFAPAPQPSHDGARLRAGRRSPELAPRAEMSPQGG